MRTHGQCEQGWVLATSVTLLAIMLLVALGSMSVIDHQTTRDRQQRERESSLNLAEGVLSAQSFSLAQRWPGTAAKALPASCASTGAGAGCPAASTLAGGGSSASFANVDQRAQTTWVTFVRDNGAPLAAAYEPALADQPQAGTNLLTGAAYTCSAPCTWDANGDRVVWVHARAIVRGRPRSIAAQLKLETLREATPQSTVVAGALSVTNSGNKRLVDGAGSQIVVRCTPDYTSNGGRSCTDFVQNKGQVYPLPVAGNPAPLMNPAQILRFRDRAIADGTYYTTCPPDLLTGAVVFVENCASPTNYDGDGGTADCGGTLPSGMTAPCVNKLTRPGVIIFRCGGFQANANWTYVGVMYFANGSDGSCTPRGNGSCSGQQYNATTDVFESKGGFGVWGALIVDGPACIKLGSNGMQVKYDPNVFNAISSYGTVGLVQNTWRELKSS